jgi:hypothetical protein
VQILVEVANIQVRSLKTEVEKGSACTVIGRGLVDPKAQANAGFEVVAFKFTCGLRHVCRKGSRLTFRHRDEESPLLAKEGAVTQTNLSTLLEVRARDLCSG